MAGYYSSEPNKNKNRITLNDLKDQLYSLNRQLLLAMQCHNQEAQDAIQNKIEEVRDRIECISLGQDRSHRSLSEKEEKKEKARKRPLY